MRRLRVWCAASAMALALFASRITIAPAADLDANKKVAYEAIELWLSGTAVKPEDILAPGYTNHLDSDAGAGGGPRVRGIAEFETELRRYRAAFSDVKVTSRMQVAEGDMVGTRVSMSAVHTGSFVGEKPTGRTIYYDSVEFTRIKDGKIYETWVTWDRSGFFRQIGANR